MTMKLNKKDFDVVKFKPGYGIMINKYYPKNEAHKIVEDIIKSYNDNQSDSIDVVISSTKDKPNQAKIMMSRLRNLEE